MDWLYLELCRAYGDAQPRRPNSAAGELIEVIISQHTNDQNTHRAYDNLLATFGNLEAVAAASPEAIAAAIRSAGLSNVKSPRIKQVLLTIIEKYGDLSLRQIRQMPPQQAMAELMTLPGVGPKTAACTLLFAFAMPVFPLDVHIYRVLQRLGIVDAKTSAEQAHPQMAAILPEDAAWLYQFHVSLITHGRQLCHARNPKCDVCPLMLRCPYGRSQSGVTAPLENHGEL